MIVIGIAGGSGAGKTTFVSALREALAEKGKTLSVIEQDVYYYDQGHLPMEERRKVNYDEPASIEFPLISQHVQDLRKGRSVEIPVYDVLSMTRSAETTPLEPSDVLVVEGILVLCDENLRAQLDLAVYLEIDPETRLQRIIKRDGEERGRDEQTVRDRVEATVEPMHQLHVLPSKASADLVFRTSGDLTESIGILCQRMGL